MGPFPQGASLASAHSAYQRVAQCRNCAWCQAGLAVTARKSGNAGDPFPRRYMNLKVIRPRSGTSQPVTADTIRPLTIGWRTISFTFDSLIVRVKNCLNSNGRILTFHVDALLTTRSCFPQSIHWKRFLDFALLSKLLQSTYRPQAFLGLNFEAHVCIVAPSRLTRNNQIQIDCKSQTSYP